MYARPPLRHPIRRPTPLPRRYQRRIPPSVLARQRRLEELRRGGPTPFQASVRRAAERFASAIRERLLDVRAGLLVFRNKLRALTRRRGRLGAY